MHVLSKLGKTQDSDSQSIEAIELKIQLKSKRSFEFLILENLFSNRKSIPIIPKEIESFLALNKNWQNKVRFSSW